MAQDEADNLHFMVKHIMKTGAVSLALAAATLLTPAALADSKSNWSGGANASGHNASGPKDVRGGFGDKKVYSGQGSYSRQKDYGGSSGSSRFGHKHSYQSHGQHDRPGYGYGEPPGHVSQFIAYDIRKAAAAECSDAIKHKTDRAFPGPFGSTRYLGTPDIKRLAPGMLRVESPVTVQGRWTSMTVPSACTLRFGKVVDLDYDPQEVRERMMRQRIGWWYGGWGHRGH